MLPSQWADRRGLATNSGWPAGLGLLPDQSRLRCLHGRLSGARPLTIIRYHILNNVLGPILVFATSLISICIILAAGLSFLGLGVTPPNAEWGLMLNNLRQALWVDPVICALPGVMIFITSMCFNLLSDGLRQAMDVRL